MRLVSLLLVAGVASAIEPFVIHRPTLVACQTTRLSWSGGEGPYVITVSSQTENGTQSRDIRRIATTSDHSAEWTVDVPAGTILTLFGTCGSESSVTRVDNVEVSANPESNDGCFDKRPQLALMQPRSVSRPKNRTGTIVGATIGSVCGAVIIAGVLLWWTGCCRRWDRKPATRKEAISKPHELDQQELGRAGLVRPASEFLQVETARTPPSPPGSTPVLTPASSTHLTTSLAPPAVPSPAATSPTSLNSPVPPMPTHGTDDQPPGYGTLERQKRNRYSVPDRLSIQTSSLANVTLANQSLATFSQPDLSMNRNRLSAQTLPDSSSILRSPGSGSRNFFPDDDDSDADDHLSPFNTNFLHGPPILDDVAIPTLSKLAPPSPSAQIFSSISRVPSSAPSTENVPTSPSESRKWKRMSALSMTSIKSSRE